VEIVRVQDREAVRRTRKCSKRRLASGKTLAVDRRWHDGRRSGWRSARRRLRDWFVEYDKTSWIDRVERDVCAICFVCNPAKLLIVVDQRERHAVPFARRRGRAGRILRHSSKLARSWIDANRIRCRRLAIKAACEVRVRSEQAPAVGDCKNRFSLFAR